MDGGLALEGAVAVEEGPALEWAVEEGLALEGGHGRGGRIILRGARGSRTRRVDRGRPIDVLLNPDG